MTQAAAVVAQPAIPVQPAILTQANVAALHQIADRRKQAETESVKDCGQSQTQSVESVDEMRQLLQLLRRALDAKAVSARDGNGSASAEVAEASPPAANRSSATDQRIERLADRVDELQTMLELLIEQRERQLRQGNTP
jgi:hypothetical protein